MLTVAPRARLRSLALAPLLVAALLAPPASAATAAAPGPGKGLAPPSLALPQRHWMAPRVHATWEADGVDVTYDVRVARADSRARRPAWRRPAALQATTDTAGSFALRSGVTVCVSVRAHLDTGETTPWTGKYCRTRAYDRTRLRTRGAVRLVTDSRMWADHALVARGGRVVLPRVRRGATIGYIVTRPDAYAGFRLTACSGVHGADFSYPGDGLVRNQTSGLPGSPDRRCRITYTRAAHTPRSFPLQGIWVNPRWAQ